MKRSEKGDDEQSVASTRPGHRFSKQERYFEPVDISLGLQTGNLAKKKSAFFQNAQDFINVNYFRTFSKLLRVVAVVFAEAHSINTDSSCRLAVAMIYEDLLNPRDWSVGGTQRLGPNCRPVKSARSESHNKGQL